jgi:hypothetical protein
MAFKFSNLTRRDESWGVPDHVGADFAFRASARTREDLLEGRESDASIAKDDGLPLEERDDWSMAAINRRGRWEE